MATQTTNYGLTKPAWDDRVDVSVLNNNSDIIDAQMHANELSAKQAVANMAAAYDATATYAEGDYCTYGGKLYQANTDISVAEAFDATHWDETTAAEHFSDGGGGGGGGTLIQPVIYSDTEREVGVWRDGKPLYQITIHISSLPQIAYGTYQIASNIDKVVDYNGVVFFSTGTIVELLYARPDDVDTEFYTAITSTKEFFLKTYKSQQGEAYVTIRYTKTTDTAGSGTWTPSGVPAVHYSTNEQIIGTWVDGKTLYQKTIDCGNLPNSTTKNVPHLISGITPSDIVDISGVGQYAGHYTIPLPKVHDGSVNSQVMIEVDDTNIILYSRNGNNASYVGYITLRYTKSTP